VRRRSINTDTDFFFFLSFNNLSILCAQTLVVSDPAMAAQLLGPSGWTRQGLDKSRVNLYR